jgi:hypothetical protein
MFAAAGGLSGKTVKSTGRRIPLARPAAPV